MADGDPAARRRWRPWLRALHRDAGYFVIGLTFIYALSGLAVNHIGQWDPSFVQVERTHQAPAPMATDETVAAADALRAAGASTKVDEVYASGDHELTVIAGKSTLTVNTATGEILEQGQDPRLFLRVANFLHLNRGKKAWTWFADGYAVLLLFLATSGLFMIPGRKGLIGRGAVVATLGAAIPIGYLVYFGGP